MIKKESNGTFTVICYKEGKQFWRRGIQTKKEALKKELELKNSTMRSLELITMDQLASQFLHHQAMSLSIGSLKSNESRYRIHIQPALGNKVVQRIQMKDILDMVYLMKMSPKGYSAVYINKIVEVTNSILNFGVQMGYLTTNPCQKFKRLKEIKNEPLYITLEDYQKIDECLSKKDPMMRIFVEVLMFTGIRLGEARALMWSQVNFESNKISIDAHVIDKGGRKRVPGRKNNRNYVIVMPQNVRRSLANLLEVEKKKDGFCAERYVFGFFDSWPYNKILRTFHKVLNEAEITQPYKLHSFRHSYASILANSGATIQELSVALGDTLAVTINTYTHMYDNINETIATRLNQIISDSLLLRENNDEQKVHNSLADSLAKPL